MNYIYCVINEGIQANLGYIGIEDKEVYIVPFKDISLVVHDSDKEPKLNKEDHVISHQYIISLLTKRFNTVIPFGINTFIKKEKTKPFLEKNYESFKKKLEQLKDKSEFIIQIFYEPKPKKTELKGSVKGFIAEQKKLRKKVLEEIAELREKFYNQVKEVADDIKIREDKESPLLSVSCLIHKDKIKEIEESLKKISNMQGFSVCLSGPLMVCSFA